MNKHRWIIESIWFSRINYTDGHSELSPVKVPSNMIQTKTGFMNGGLFTMKDAHYAAFGSSGFGVKNIELGRKNTRFCTKTKMYEVI